LKKLLIDRVSGVIVSQLIIIIKKNFIFIFVLFFVSKRNY